MSWGNHRSLIFLGSYANHLLNAKRPLKQASGKWPPQSDVNIEDGPDGILPELLKYAEEPISRALHELFHKMRQLAEYPSSGRKALCRCTRERMGKTSAPVICIYPPVGSGESICPRSTEQTGATANENPALAAIWFHEGKINYGCNPRAASTIKTLPRVWQATKCRLH